MLPWLLIAFVVACALMVVVAMWREHRFQAEAQEWLREDASELESVRPEWIYGPRMDVPGRYPLLRTRSAKVLSK